MSALLLLAAGGAGTVLDSQSVTPGAFSSGGGPVNVAWSGFGSGSGVPPFGAIADGTSNLYSGAAIAGIYMFESYTTSPPLGYTQRDIVLAIAGSLANSGWEKMLVGVQQFLRSAATFGSSGGNTTWTWPQSIPNPFVSAMPGPFATNPTAVQFTN